MDLYDLLDPLWRLLLAGVLTALVGLERELRAKPAGLRTNVVVGVASAAIAYVGAVGFEGGDPSRLASQVVSGIGFLGAGAIFAFGGRPRGLTTAAALWASAATGLAAGSGAPEVAVLLVVVTLAILQPLDWLGGRLEGSAVPRRQTFTVLLDDVHALAELRGRVQESTTEVVRLGIREIGDHVVVDLVVRGGRDELRRVEDLVRDLDDVLLLDAE